MKAITVVPGKPEQVQVSELSDPEPEPGTMLVRGRLLGVIECTGHGPLVFDLANIVAPDAVICLTGISSGTRTVSVGLDQLNKAMVLENTVLFGSVNAGRRHYQQAAEALAKVDRSWLERLITRRVPMSGFAEALHKSDDDVKVVVDLKA
ncbi:MAG: hypothetical protein DLM67_05225 [Candidatus Nephthysia bennettiae]|nr:MAG: hypothetical protein DLM67_05225 [Candidatus Dormibacteraeota bacterium]